MGIVLGWSALLLFAGVPFWLYLGIKGIKTRTAIYAAFLAAGPIYLALLFAFGIEFFGESNKQKFPWFATLIALVFQPVQLLISYSFGRSLRYVYRKLRHKPA